jgi:RHS repeat-associated protein
VAKADASGVATDTQGYGPFGEPDADIGAGPGSNTGGRFGFTGAIRLHEATPDLHLMGTRVYSASLGRFIEPDPIGTTDDINLYGYAACDPINLFDPSGLAAEAINDWGSKTAFTSWDYCGMVCGKLGPYAGDGTRLITPGGPVSRFGALGKAAGIAPFGLSVARGVQVISRLGTATRIETTVIGKLEDLKSLRPGEKPITWPNRGSHKTNWKANSGLLRQAMGRGRPIRDASVDSSGNLINNTGFLRAERNLLQSRGWRFDPSTTNWHPPGA